MLDTIETAIEAREDRRTNLDGWADQPTHHLIAHIVACYHRPLDEELPRLQLLADKVARVHGASDERLDRLAFTLSALKAELEAHMVKEEQLLFPSMLLRGASDLACPIAVMFRNHDDANDLLEIIRGLTDDFAVPPSDCRSWRALWQGLEDLDRSLREHIHLENNVLFPRVS